jgi:hypothetical protein
MLLDVGHRAWRRVEHPTWNPLLVKSRARLRVSHFPERKSRRQLQYVMPRLARVVAAGLPHKVTQRGNDRQNGFCFKFCENVAQLDPLRDKPWCIRVKFQAASLAWSTQELMSLLDSGSGGECGAAATALFRYGLV